LEIQARRVIVVMMMVFLIVVMMMVFLKVVHATDLLSFGEVKMFMS